MKLYTRFALLGCLLGAYTSVYSQFHAMQVQSEATGTSSLPPAAAPDGSGGVLSAIIFGILGAICGLVCGFLVRLALSLAGHGKAAS